MRHRLPFALVVCWSLSAVAQPIRDLIQPVHLVPARTDTLLLSDLYYAEDYDITFVPQGVVAVRHDRQAGSVAITPSRAFVGVSVVEFNWRNGRYAVPVIVQKPTREVAHRFTFRARPGASVSVMGSFNGWNRASHPLNDERGTGVYALDVKLRPGIYLYKLVVDGQEGPDPSNPEKSPTGFDDFNSVLRVVDPDPGEFHLHLDGRRATAGGWDFRFRAESPTGAEVRPDQVVALVNNRRVPASGVRTNGALVTVRLTSSDLAGTTTVRVLAARKGSVANLQQIVLRDGEPAGEEPQAAAWEDGIIYSIMIDRFRNGDPKIDAPIVHDSISRQANYHGGDFRGIIQTLDEGYFDSLGINILWISPVYDNPNVAFREYPAPNRWYSGYHGYWPISDTAVEEKFGTMADLRELVRKAHARGIRVLLDFVAHHVHIDHPWYRNHPEWFGTLDLPDGRKNLRLWDEFRLTTWFEPYMPSFDYTKSHVPIDVMAENAVWWLEQTGADGFRHDAVKHVPNEFWRSLTRTLKQRVEVPKNTTVYQIGETFGDYDLIASYVRNGQLSSQFNFNLSYFAIPVFLEPDQSFESLDFHMRKTFDAFGRYHLMGNIMDSHDKVRFMTYADGDVQHQGVDTREMAWTNPPTVDHPSSYRKAELYLAYMFTIPGLPVVYYGSEFGMTGADDPDNRRPMRFGEDLTDLERDMLARSWVVSRLRHRHSALRHGDFLTLLADRSIYAYMRSDLRERLLIVLNKSGEDREPEIVLPRAIKARRVIDVESGDAWTVSGRKVNIPVDGIGWRVLRVE
ncbi:MAG: alpha-amylase family glycosyl hydrolase [Bacteroidetes bacterium]|nr:alpha-amylase family glycosyl hydrolase [Bacteroidota bacterium]